MLDLAGSPHLSDLADREVQLKPKLDALLDELALAVVGKGYIDIIIAPARADEILSECTRLGCAVTLITLWCDCTAGHRRTYGRPHGYGGPADDDGFFSELCEEDYYQADDHGVTAPQMSDEIRTFVAQCNGLARAYITTGIRQRSDYSPCLVTGLWLGVPNHWENRHRSTES